MGSDDPDNCPTFTRRPPAPGDPGPGSARAASQVAVGVPGSTPPLPPSGAPPADDDDGPITDVDDEPPTFSLGTPRVPTLVEEVTLVNAAPPHQRLLARVVTADPTHLFVLVEGEPAARRISRVACFEHPVGGGWSTWRLSGADRERWHVAGPLPTMRPSAGDASA